MDASVAARTLGWRAQQQFRLLPPTLRHALLLGLLTLLLGLGTLVVYFTGAPATPTLT